MDNYKVSVVVLTYNPDKDRLLATLRSIVQQKNIRFQIIIADDGSENAEFEAAERLFKKNGFIDYVLLKNQQNQGTVRNMYSAIEKCTGTYIKSISPGDLLCGENILRMWIEAMEETGAIVSCCDAVYYVPHSDVMEPVVRKANPQYTACYLQNRPEEARYNYLILDDLFLGAAIVCRKDVQKEYMEEILGKVIYAEDHIYRLMAYDRVPMHYYPECGVLYETATGISTSGSDFWRQKLKDDWDAASELLLARCTGKDPIDRYLRRLLALPEGGLRAKLVKYLMIPKMLAYRLRCKIYPRKSNSQFPDTNEEVLWK